MYHFDSLPEQAKRDLADIWILYGQLRTKRERLDSGTPRRIDTKSLETMSEGELTLAILLAIRCGAIAVERASDMIPLSELEKYNATYTGYVRRNNEVLELLHKIDKRIDRVLSSPARPRSRKPRKQGEGRSLGRFRL